MRQTVAVSGWVRELQYLQHLACCGHRDSDPQNYVRCSQRRGSRRGNTSYCETKFSKTRYVPLDARLGCLKEYSDFRIRCTHVPSGHFFLTTRGTQLTLRKLESAMGLVRRCLSVGSQIGAKQRTPRLYDLRHSFACMTIRRWLSAGDDINHRLLLLCAYLGHVKPSDTYWYLTGTPELFALVCARFEEQAASPSWVMPMTTSFQVMLQNFFVKRLMNQRQASPCTVAAYRDTFRLLLRYMRDQKGISPACITIDTLDAATVVEFLSYLRNTRLNSDATVNHRLAAIHSFLDYVSYEQPEHTATARRILGIPFRSTDRKVVNYLTREEMTLLLNSCDTSSFRGRRDRVIVLLLYNTGIRVSELVNLKRSDVTISADGKGYVRVLGKGRKERVIPL